MKVTKITVTYTELRSFGNHNSVNPSVTYEADFDSTRDPIIGDTYDLMDVARSQVRILIDDALEANGHSPAYDTDDLYRVFFSNRRKMVVIAKSTAPTRADFFPHGVAVRLLAAQKSAFRYTQITGFELIDGIFGSDDFEELEAPDLPEVNEDEIPF